MSNKQVTRLLCGGFIFAIRFNHTMSDATGLALFLNAVGEMARGLQSPTVPPVWNRELLDARNPPNPTCVHREYDVVPDTDGTIDPLDDLVHRSFFFGPKEIASLKKQVPPHMRPSSTFEVLTACLWKCRTIALRPDPDEEVRIISIVNARNKFEPPLPRGFYGNVIAFPVAVSRADRLCGNPLGYALGLVKEAKAKVTEEYMRSVADLMVLRGRPHFTKVRSYVVSDVTRARAGDVDFGWGKAVYAGPVGEIPGVGSFYIPFRDGIVVPVCLPGPAMERFVEEIQKLTQAPSVLSPL